MEKSEEKEKKPPQVKEEDSLSFYNNFCLVNIMKKKNLEFSINMILIF